MDIELIPLTLAANASVRLERSGRYVEIISASAASSIASIVLSDASGAQTAFMRNLLAGVYAEISFSAIDVTNGPTAQVIVLMVTDGRGGSRRQPGEVSIIDAIGAGVQTTGMANVLAIGTLATQLLDPLTNLRGAILRQATLEATAGAAGTVNSRILAAPTTPVSPNGNQLALNILLANTTTQAVSGLYDLKKRIPSGWGVWHYTIVTAAVATTNSGSISYELQT